VGACIAYRLPDGRWGAAVAVKARPGWAGYNFIKVLHYRDREKPLMRIFEARRWLIYLSDPLVIQLADSVVKNSPGDYEQIGILKLLPQDDYTYYQIMMGDIGTIVADMF
jgi:hypothetical protein